MKEFFFSIRNKAAKSPWIRILKVRLNSLRKAYELWEHFRKVTYQTIWSSVRIAWKLVLGVFWGCLVHFWTYFRPEHFRKLLSLRWLSPFLNLFLGRSNFEKWPIEYKWKCSLYEYAWKLVLGGFRDNRAHFCPENFRKVRRISDKRFFVFLLDLNFFLNFPSLNQEPTIFLAFN